MRKEKRNNGISDYEVLIADEGKTLRRMADGMEYGDEVALGYTHYIGGVPLDEPHKDVAEDFEEIAKPGGWREEINGLEGER